jgi:hypothetical protein
VTDGTIDPAAVGIKLTNRYIVKCNEGSKSEHHQQMHAAVVTGVEKSYTENVRYTGSPITIEDCSASKPTQNTGSTYRKFHKLIELLLYFTKK